MLLEICRLLGDPRIVVSASDRCRRVGNRDVRERRGLPQPDLIQRLAGVRPASADAVVFLDIVERSPERDPGPGGRCQRVEVAGLELIGVDPTVDDAVTIDLDLICGGDFQRTEERDGNRQRGYGVEPSESSRDSHPSIHRISDDAA